MLSKSLFGIYLAIRFVQAGELGLVAYAEAHSFDLAATVMFCFLFGMAVILVGVARLGERIAITWHVILETMLIPLSLELAWNAAMIPHSTTSPLGALSIDQRFVLMAILFGAIQSLLAVAGLHIVKWTANN